MSNSSEYYQKWKNSNSHISIFLPNYEEYSDKEKFVKYLEIRGGYKLDLNYYYSNDQVVNEEELPLLEDIHRLLNCLEMRSIYQVEADLVKKQNHQMRTEISDLQSRVKTLSENLDMCSLNITKLDENNGVLREQLQNLKEVNLKQKQEIKRLRDEIYNYLNKPVQHTEVQCNIITKEQTSKSY